MNKAAHGVSGYQACNPKSQEKHSDHQHKTSLEEWSNAVAEPFTYGESLTWLALQNELGYG